VAVKPTDGVESGHDNLSLIYMTYNWKNYHIPPLRGKDENKMLEHTIHVVVNGWEIPIFESVAKEFGLMEMSSPIRGELAQKLLEANTQRGIELCKKLLNQNKQT
jgi:hypothetical protein